MAGEGAGAGMLSSLSAALFEMKMAKEGDLQTKSPETNFCCLFPAKISDSEPGGEAEEDEDESMGFGLFDDDSSYVATSDRKKKGAAKIPIRKKRDRGGR